MEPLIFGLQRSALTKQATGNKQPHSTSLQKSVFVQSKTGTEQNGLKRSIYMLSCVSTRQWQTGRPPVRPSVR
jgi:hypothetical protein